jgi:hypothetical protein
MNPQETTRATLRTRVTHPHSLTWLALLVLVGLALALVGCGTTPQASTAAPNARPAQEAQLTATSTTPVNLTQTQAGLEVTLKVTPDAYGPNQFGVVLLNAASRQPVEGASVQLLSTMLDMNMGTTRFDLSPQGQGFYVGQSDLGMGGNWQMVARVRLPNAPTTRLSFTFLFSAAIWQGANG